MTLKSSPGTTKYQYHAAIGSQELKGCIDWVNAREAEIQKQRNMKKIYLAGPDVFRKNAIEHLQGLKDLCSAYGFEGLSPLDNQISPTAKHVAALIFAGNLDSIDLCDIVIANLDPFRGPNVDDGTAFEIGYAYSQGKTIYGYTLVNQAQLKDLTKLYDHNYSVYPQVEDFGACRNLMIVYAIVQKGKIMRRFEDCLKDLSGDKG